MTDDHRDRAARLASHLADLDGIDPGWAASFAEVPRHRFVPAFYPSLDTENGSPPRLLDGSAPAHRRAWLDTVYTDRSLITQCAVTPGTTDLWQSTSSSTRPSLMARMLTLLDAAPDLGLRVLEIGTGTGYNAAILSHRLGANAVASLDLDPGLVDLARSRLATLGHHPTLAVADGALGLPAEGPYDRILATCAVPSLPRSWIEQLRPGGLILADVRGGLESSLLVARRGRDDSVGGRFLAEPGHFMWMRRHLDNPLRDGGELATQLDYGTARSTDTSIEAPLLADPDFRFLLQLIVPGVEQIWTTRRGDGPVVRISAADGGWIELDPTDHTAIHNSQAELIAGIQRATTIWHQHGRPQRTRLGVTQRPTGSAIWLDSPDHLLAV